MDRLRARGLTQFTSAQASALGAGLCKGVNLLVCAPTSSGKPLIAELAAAEGARKGDKTVYLVSHRALAEEKYHLFKNEYASTSEKWLDVSIATGDRNEGNWATGILVATYEKYLAMVCASGHVSMAGVVVVADEIQILGDDDRRPEIELLCALLRSGSPRQVVALSATV
ncbi:MAG: DEAD/DEAH box helicase [Gammaproteobacteria bacterium]